MTDSALVCAQFTTQYWIPCSATAGAGHADAPLDGTPMNMVRSVPKIAARNRILPLHLRPADLLWVAQDLPGYPSTFDIHLELSGRIDRRAWETAVGEVLERHPLLGAHVRPAKRGLPCWVAAPTGLPPIDWSVEGAPIACPSGEAIILSYETGLRISNEITHKDSCLAIC